MAIVETWSPPPDTAPPAAARVTAEILGIPDARLATVRGASKAGFRFGAFKRLAKALGLDQRTLAGLLGMSAGMLARRQRKGRFTQFESDRMWLLLRLYLRALVVHGSEEAAREWLSSPLPALGRLTALEVATNSAGAQRALDVLGQIQQGVFG